MARPITEPLRDLEPLEALVLDLDRLDHHLVGLGGVLRRRRVLRHPSAVQHELLHRAVVVDVVEEDLDLAAEVGVRQPRRIGDLVVPDRLERPALELLVLGEPGLERDRLVVGPARRQLLVRREVVARAELHDIDRPGEAAHLATRRDLDTSQHDAEVEVAVRIALLGIDETSHGILSYLMSSLNQPSCTSSTESSATSLVIESSLGSGANLLIHAFCTW